jgi:hypothetical protein
MLLRISLRGLLVLSTIICLWVGKISIDARSQKNAVVRVRQLGGNVRYDWQEPVDVGGGNFADPMGPSAPEWLRSWLGDEYFQDVVSVYCSGKDFDATVLAGLPRLRGVSLEGCSLDDASPLADLSELRSLSLRKNLIVDVSPLANLVNLEFLDLSDNQITDCSTLLKLQNLRQLEIQRNPLDQDQIDSLSSALPNAGKTWSAPK